MPSHRCQLASSSLTASRYFLKLGPWDLAVELLQLLSGEASLVGSGELLVIGVLVWPRTIFINAGFLHLLCAGVAREVSVVKALAQEGNRQVVTIEVLGQDALAEVVKVEAVGPGRAQGVGSPLLR